MEATDVQFLSTNMPNNDHELLLALAGLLEVEKSKLGNLPGNTSTLRSRVDKNSAKAETKQNKSPGKQKLVECEEDQVELQEVQESTSQSAPQNKKYTCHLCPSNFFSSKRTLRNHIRRIHEGNKFLYKCPKCPERFSHYRKRQRHILQNDCTEPQQITWGVHNYEEPSERRENFEENSEGGHEDKSSSTCSICGAEMNGKSELETHFKEVHRIGADCIKAPPKEVNHRRTVKPFQDEDFLSDMPLDKKVKKKARQIRNQVSVRKCKYCGEEFRRTGYLIRHQLSHPEAVRYQCSVCKLRFSQVVTYNRHIKINKHKQIPGKPMDFLNLSCHECKKEFTDYSTFCLHLQTSSRQGCLTTDKGIRCAICKAYLPSHQAMRAHQISFHRLGSSRNVVNRRTKKLLINITTRCCNICGKIVSYSHYRFHMDAHKGLKKYKCEICGFKTAFPSLVRAHRKNHQGDPGSMFYCKICNAPFISKRSCILHEFTHEEVPKPRCSKCGKEFTSDFMYNRHIKKCGMDTNTGGSNPLLCHKCGICSELFKWKRLAELCEDSHKKYEHYKRPCWKCGKELTSEVSYKAHVKRRCAVVKIQNEENATRKDRGPYKCVVCSVLFRFFQWAFKCEESHRSFPDYKRPCGKCGLALTSEIAYEKHVCNRIKDRQKVVPKCNVCSEQYGKRRCAEKCENSHKSCPNYKCKCTMCDKELTSRYSFTYHSQKCKVMVKELPIRNCKQSSMQTGLHKCSLCPLQYRTQGGAKKCKDSHISCPDYKCKCTKCGEEFTSRYSYEAHGYIKKCKTSDVNQKSKIANNEKCGFVGKCEKRGLYKCSLCPVYYTQRCLADKCKTSHNTCSCPEYKCACSKCGTEFTSRYSYEFHTERKRCGRKCKTGLHIKCRLCSEQYSQRCFAEECENSHRSFPGYKCACSRCGKELTSQYSYREHIKNCGVARDNLGIRSQIDRANEPTPTCGVCSKEFSHERWSSGAPLVDHCFANHLLSCKEHQKNRNIQSDVQDKRNAENYKSITDNNGDMQNASRTENVPVSEKKTYRYLSFKCAGCFKVFMCQSWSTVTDQPQQGFPCKFRGRIGVYSMDYSTVVHLLCCMEQQSRVKQTFVPVEEHIVEDTQSGGEPQNDAEIIGAEKLEENKHQEKDKKSDEQIDLTDMWNEATWDNEASVVCTETSQYKQSQSTGDEEEQPFDIHLQNCKKLKHTGVDLSVKHEDEEFVIDFSSAKLQKETGIGETEKGSVAVLKSSSCGEDEDFAKDPSCKMPKRVEFSSVKYEDEEFTIDYNSSEMQNVVNGICETDKEANTSVLSGNAVNAICETEKESITPVISDKVPFLCTWCWSVFRARADFMKHSPSCFNSHINFFIQPSASNMLHRNMKCGVVGENPELKNGKQK